MSSLPDVFHTLVPANFHATSGHVEFMFAVDDRGIHATLNSPSTGFEYWDNEPSTLLRLAGHILIAFMPDEGLPETIETLKGYCEHYSPLLDPLPVPAISSGLRGTVVSAGIRPPLVFEP